MSGFPEVRMRRLRRSEGLRRLVRETGLHPAQLVWPMFFKLGGDATPIAAMPGVVQHPLNEAGELARRAADVGVGAVLLFGIPNSKDDVAGGAYAEDGVIQQVVRAMKQSSPETVVITDVCLCEYMSHGHCGIVRDGSVDNDATLELLARTAVSHATAGCDMVAPSDMMDGRVRAIRSALDAQGFNEIPIMSYAAKYASAFYGPFREAAGSTPQFGDRRGYQMDPGNADEALREIALDLEEGADIVMVKPGLPYLDIVWRAKERFGGPLAVFQVSGEYAMIKLAAQAGAFDEERAMEEALLGLRRAGADILITYAAADVAERLASR